MLLGICSCTISKLARSSPSLETGTIRINSLALSVPCFSKNLVANLSEISPLILSKSLLKLGCIKDEINAICWGLAFLSPSLFIEKGVGSPFIKSMNGFSTVPDPPRFIISSLSTPTATLSLVSIPATLGLVKISLDGISSSLDVPKAVLVRSKSATVLSLKESELKASSTNSIRFVTARTGFLLSASILAWTSEDLTVLSFCACLIAAIVFKYLAFTLGLSWSIAFLTLSFALTLLFVADVSTPASSSCFPKDPCLLLFFACFAASILSLLDVSANCNKSI